MKLDSLSATKSGRPSGRKGDGVGRETLGLVEVATVIHYTAR